MSARQGPLMSRIVPRGAIPDNLPGPLQKCRADRSGLAARRLGADTEWAQCLSSGRSEGGYLRVDTMEKMTRRDAMLLSAVGVFPLGALAAGAGEGAMDAPGARFMTSRSRAGAPRGVPSSVHWRSSWPMAQTRDWVGSSAPPRARSRRPFWPRVTRRRR